MTREAFIRDVLKTWELSECKLLLTPEEAGSTVELPSEGTDGELNPEDILRAQKLAGSLIWLSTRTRPDISYAQSRVSSMATKAPRTALLEGIRVLRYLQGTKDVGLRFEALEGCDGLIAYTDANFQPTDLRQAQWSN